MFNIRVDYPNEEEEFQIVKRTTADVQRSFTPTLNSDEIAALSRIVRRVPIADHVARYALQFTRLTRKEKGDVPDFIRKYVSGAPVRGRASIWCSRQRLALCWHGRYFANCDDIRAVAPPVLRHRILTNFNAEAEGIKPTIWCIA